MATHNPYTELGSLLRGTPATDQQASEQANGQGARAEAGGSGSPRRGARSENKRKVREWLAGFQMPLAGLTCNLGARSQAWLGTAFEIVPLMEEPAFVFLPPSLLLAPVHRR
jgi:hypothetical protein